MMNKLSDLAITISCVVEFCVLLLPDEFEQGKVIVKRLSDSKQETIEVGSVVQYLQNNRQK